MAFNGFRIFILAMLCVQSQHHGLVMVNGNPVLFVTIGGRPTQSSDDDSLLSGAADYYMINGENAPFDIATVQSQNLGLSDTAFTVIPSSKTLFIVGGVHDNGDKPENDFFEYDMADNTRTVWQSVPHPLGLNVAQNSLVSMNDRYLVSMGGGTGDSWTPTNSMYIYDQCKFTWSPGNSLPNNVQGGAAVVLDGTIFYIGSRSSTVGNRVFRLKSLFGAWEQMTNANYNPVYLTQPRFHLRAVVVNRFIIAIGGSRPYSDDPLNTPTNFEDSKSVEYAVIDGNGNGQWTYLNNMRVGRYFFGATVIPGSNSVLVCGGYYDGGSSSDYPLASTDVCEVMNMDDNSPQWTDYPTSLHRPLANFVMFALDYNQPFFDKTAKICSDLTSTTTTTTTLPPCKFPNTTLYFGAFVLKLLTVIDAHPRHR